MKMIRWSRHIAHSLAAAVSAQRPTYIISYKFLPTTSLYEVLRIAPENCSVILNRAVWIIRRRVKHENCFSIFSETKVWLKILNFYFTKKSHEIFAFIFGNLESSLELWLHSPDSDIEETRVEVCFVKKAEAARGVVQRSNRTPSSIFFVLDLIFTSKFTKCFTS